jgi:F-type H+-transporting ATPase subunit delta
MPLLNSLATPYADALLQVTDSRQESEEVAAQCKTLLIAWESSEPLRNSMTSPVLEPEAKKESIKHPSC